MMFFCCVVAVVHDVVNVSVPAVSGLTPVATQHCTFSFVVFDTARTYELPCVPVTPVEVSVPADPATTMIDADCGTDTVTDVTYVLLLVADVWLPNSTGGTGAAI